MIAEAIADTSFPKHELTLNDLEVVLEEMIATGEAELTTNGLHLSPILCEGAAALVDLPPAMPTVFPLMGRDIAVFHRNDCAMTENICREVVTAPIFPPVPQVKLRKRLNLARDAERVNGAIAGMIVAG